MTDKMVRYDNACELGEIFKLASALRQASGFLPPHLRSEGEIVAVILAGRELGLPPMVALRSVHLIKGKVVLAADVQLGLMKRAGVRHRWLKDGTEGEAALELTRDGDKPHVTRFTLAMAQAAGLLGNDTWKKHPAAMLRARCVSAAGKAYMPDVLAGCYVPGELDDVEPAPVLTVVSSLPAAPAPVGLLGTTQQTPDGGFQAAQAPAQGAPRALPAPDGVPPDEAPQAAPGREDFRALLELYRGKLHACKTPEEFRGWIDALQHEPLNQGQRGALWGAFCQRVREVGLDVERFKKGGK